MRVATGFRSGYATKGDEIMRWEDFRSSDNVEDRRGEGGGGGGGFPGGGAGGLGIGTIVILCIIGWVTGINPAILIGGAEQMSGGGQPRQERVDPQTQAQRKTKPADESGRFAAAILGNTEDVWKEILPNQTGKQYRPTGMVLYTGGTRSGCGSAQAAMGPFYCPLDKKVYLDTSFFKEMEQKFGVKGDFAYAYVIAHEVGHHVQDELGILGKVQGRQQAASSKVESNQLSVRVELMADCLAASGPRTQTTSITLWSPVTSRKLCRQLVPSATISSRSSRRATPCRIPSRTARRTSGCGGS